MAAHTDIKPIKVWGKGGPNPPKVEMLLVELGIPHEITPVSFADVKKPEYTAINPNGRLPSIHDPNTGLTLWESGAILEYLVDTYDKDRKLSFPAGTHDAWHAKQWLFFQTTGQAPYYGQAAWFHMLHHERLPSAVERYTKEIQRVLGVLDGWLVKQKDKYAGEGDGPWLVANKLSYADLAFIPWQIAIAFVLGDLYSDQDFPEVRAWLARMQERPGVAQVVSTMLQHNH